VKAPKDKDDEMLDDLLDTPTTKGSPSSPPPGEFEDVEIQASKAVVKSNLNKKFEEDDSDDESSVGSVGLSSKQIFCYASLLVIIGILVFVVVFVVFLDKDETASASAPDNLSSPVAVPVVPGSPTLAPAEAPVQGTVPTASPVSSPTNSGTGGAGALEDFFEAEGVSIPLDETAPTRQALEWLLDEQEEDGSEPVTYDDQLLQRFAVLVLDFAMLGNQESSDVRRRELVRTQQNQDTCLWSGISCTSLDGDDSQRVVTSIRWGQQGLHGSIPSEIGLLSHLEYFSAPENSLQGSLPEEIYTKLPNLESLYLYKNKLTGSLSESIGNLNSLVNFHLSHNEITGFIPSSLRSLDEIRPLRK